MRIGCLPAGLLWLGIFPILAGAQQPAAPLGTAREVRELSREMAARALPVRMEGVVTFVSPANGAFIVADATTGIFVSTPDAAVAGLPPPEQNFEGPPGLGMKVEVIGITAPGGFAPIIIPRQIRFLGPGFLPRAVPVTIADLQTGRFDCERVQVRGVVQHAAFGVRGIDAVRLELAAVGGHFVAYALVPGGFDPQRLEDAEVSLSGLALTFFNERGEIVGARVQLHGIEDVEIVRPAPATPFDAPEARLDSLLPFSPQQASLHRQRVSGTVTVCRPGAYFYIQEGDRAVRVSTRATVPLAPGDRVEVSGFVELLESFAELREAVVRKLGSAAVPPAQPITRAAVLRTNPWQAPPRSASHLDGRRVVLQGRLEKVESIGAEGRRISLDCDGHLIFATLAQEEPRAALQRLVPGSDVSVTGVCRVQLSGGRPTLSNPVPTGFELLVHSPEDVAVLRVPPWWTLRRLWLALGGTGLVLAMALIWAWMLRRRVAQRSAELEAEIGARRDAAVVFEATLRERRRLAADLHDTLEQALTGLALQLEAVDIFQRSEPERGTRHLQLARQFLARSRDDVRRTVWNLRAQGLEGRTFGEALREMAIAQGEAGGVRVEIEIEGEEFPLPDFIASNLLLLAQESVTNSLKHAAAQAITLRVTFGSEGVSLTLEDDGRGFDVAHVPGMKEGHFGLQGMRERVRRIGGKLEITSGAGRGTRIAARVPVGAFESIVES